MQELTSAVVGGSKSSKPSAKEPQRLLALSVRNKLPLKLASLSCCVQFASEKEAEIKLSHLTQSAQTSAAAVCVELSMRMVVEREACRCRLDTIAF